MLISSEEGYHWKKIRCTDGTSRSCRMPREEHMKNKIKQSVLALTAAAFSAAMLPANLMNVSAWDMTEDSDYFDWRLGAYYPGVATNFLAKINEFGADNCDFDGNGTGAEIEDFYELEATINALYAETGYDRDEEIDSAPDYQAYDINNDKKVTPEDYCYLLQYAQKDFDFILDYGEMTATITRYKGKTAPHVTVPREVYAKGRIFPVMAIADDVFQNHTELTSISFDNYVQPVWRIRRTDSVNTFPYQLMPGSGEVMASTYLYLGENVFSGCSELHTIVLPPHIRFANDDPFNGAQYLEEHVQEVDGIRYLYDNTASVYAAFDLTDEKKEEINSAAEGTYCLRFSDKTTSICNSLTDQIEKNALKDVYIPETVAFIEDYAFAGCKNLQTVSGNTYAKCSPEQLRFVKRYLCAFDNTPFIANEVQKLIAQYASEIRKECNNCATEAEKKAAVIKVGKLIAQLADYRTYYSVGIKNSDEDYGPDNPKMFTRGFILYPNDRYYYNDLCRGSISSAGAVFLLGDGETPAYTECVAFAHASSLMLDQLGIRNLFCGQPSHALNAVYLDGKWYKFDMSRNSLYDPDSLTEGMLLMDMEDNMTIGWSNQFEMFPNSRGKHIPALFFTDIVITKGNENPAKLTVLTKEELSDAEKNELGQDDIICRKEELEPGWHQFDDYYYYMDSNGRFRRNTYAPDEYGNLYWVNENGQWDPYHKDS